MKLFSLFLKDRKDPINISADSYQFEPENNPERVVFIAENAEIGFVLARELQAVTSL